MVTAVPLSCSQRIEFLPDDAAEEVPVATRIKLAIAYVHIRRGRRNAIASRKETESTGLASAHQEVRLYNDKVGWMQTNVPRLTYR